MNISELFIRRPVMTTLATMGLVIAGFMTYPLLPVSDLPNVDFPVISVSASLPGASPETMASAVATPLEKQFSTISGLDEMTSSSSLGSTRITLQFNLDRDIDAAAQDVQSAISQTVRQLPSDMPSPPSYRKINPADQPILFIALTSPTLPLSVIDRYAQTFLAQRISMVNGVAQVQVYGSQKYAVRIRLNPKAMAAWKIGVDEVQSAVSGANVNLPTGTLDSNYQTFTVEVEGQLLKASAYRKLIIAYRNGSPVRLEDIGEILDSTENDKEAAWYCDAGRQQRSVMLAIQRQPGTNTVEVAKSVKDLLPMFQSLLPPAVSMELMFDRSDTISDSVKEVKFTMILTLCLVVLVIFLFLRNMRATMIPAMSLPLSILGTFVIMYFCDYSLDNLSLMALTLCIGFVVDDAIVMLENIFRHLEMGKSKIQAALDGSREIVFTIISMTVSLSAVFIPLLFMGGIVGRLFQEFGVTIGVAVLVSGVVSLTLIPMMCSRFMARAVAEKKEESVQDSFILRFYDRTLRWNIRHWKLVMLFSIAVLALMFQLFKVIPKGFLPSEDQNRLMGSVEMVQGISFPSLYEHQQKVAGVVQKDPNVAAFMSRCGGNTGNVFLRLTPKKERKLTADQIAQKLRKEILQEVPGVKIFIQNPPPIQVGGRMSRAMYQYTLQSPDTDELIRHAIIVEKQMSGMPALQDISSDLQMANPQVTLEIDRDKASMLHISAAQIESALYSAFGPRKISTIYAPEDQYSVLMELMPEFKKSSESLSLIYVHSASGDLVPLEDLIIKKLETGPLSINHSGQLPSVTISFNLKPGESLGPAVEKIEKEIQANLPGSISAKFQGTAQAFKDSMKGMIILLVLTLVVIYIVLGILYESFIHPVTILTALPFAGVGALLSLYLLDIELSLYAFVGLIMLVGIVKKNGIMMIDFAITREREGRSPEDAIVEACLIRFRPIMMTTAAAIMAGIPIAIGWGTGSESRRPFGITIVGGLIFSQLLTLYVTPVFYVVMEKLRKLRKRREANEDFSVSIADNSSAGPKESSFESGSKREGGS